MAEKVTIGNCELWHGDCRDVLPLLPKVDLVLTDPPYGINFASNPHSQSCIKHDRMDWDVSAPDDDLIANVIELGAQQIVWGGNYFNVPKSQSFLVWDKMQPENFSMAMAEFAFFSVKKPAKIFRMHPASFQKEHPTQKPVELMEWCINLAPKTTLTVADPFAGAGTTGVACVRMGKTFYGIEREPKYFDIMCERIQREVDRPQLFPFSCGTADTGKQDYQYGLQQQLIQTCEKE